VEILRDGKSMTVNVTVAKLKEETVAVDGKNEKSNWGLSLRELRPQERSRLGVTDHDGVVVENVAPVSAAAEAGVQRGDVILQVNRVAVDSVAAVKAEVAKAKADQPLLLLLRRADGNTGFVALAAR
jgi:serine protease Do